MNKVFRLVPRRAASRVAAIVAGASALLGSAAHAALDAGVTTEITTAGTDVRALGVLVFGIAVGIVLYKWFKRAL